ALGVKNDVRVGEEDASHYLKKAALELCGTRRRRRRSGRGWSRSARTRHQEQREHGHGQDSHRSTSMTKRLSKRRRSLLSRCRDTQGGAPHTLLVHAIRLAARNISAV